MQFRQEDSAITGIASEQCVVRWCADDMGRAARTWHHGRCSTATDGAHPRRNIFVLTRADPSPPSSKRSGWLRRSLPASNAILRKLDAQEEMPPSLLHRWRCDAGHAWRNIKRIVVAFEAGRDGFRLARWLRRDVEAYVIHPTSIAVSREHRRAKTDRDTELLMRVFLGWLRGETRHFSMVAIPTIEEEDAGQTVSARIWSLSKRGLSTRSRRYLPASAFALLRPTVRKLAEGLEDLRTAEGTSLPQNTLIIPI
jgi:hypothetical protein